MKRKRTTQVGTAMLETVKEMNCETGFDCVIVCTSNLAQERYWQERLECTRGQAAKADALILAVHEDWAADGAGNGLGTLYAYMKARDKAAADNHDLDAFLASGHTVGIFHTAGKGTRMAPLPGAENNNKPGVKLPSLVETAPGKFSELTILEAVIRQTGCYAPKRKGRCSVFWGDQIFIPSVGHLESGAHHADILAKLGPMPSEEEWILKGLDKYGLISVNKHDEAAQIEKVSFRAAKSILSGFGENSSIGPSLGSFSLSKELLAALLLEFKVELNAKTAKMDSDPHFWMPMTLSKEVYVNVMSSKGVDSNNASAHFDRMSKFKAQLLKSHPEKACIGAVDVGESCYWWDFGQIQLYKKNIELALDDSQEAEALREYLKIPDKLRVQASNLGDDVTLSDGSICLASGIRRGNLTASIASRVNSTLCNVSNCILINVTAKSIKANNCVIYNVVDESDNGLVLPDGAVVTNVFIPGKPKLVQTSSVTTDGGKMFKSKLTMNPFSFEDVYKMNQSIDVQEAYATGAAAHEALQEHL